MFFFQGTANIFKVVLPLNIPHFRKENYAMYETVKHAMDFKMFMITC